MVSGGFGLIRYMFGEGGEGVERSETSSTLMVWYPDFLAFGVNSRPQQIKVHVVRLHQLLGEGAAAVGGGCD
jgi:hypothetical protein